MSLPIKDCIPNYYESYLQEIDDNQTSYLEVYGFTVIENGIRIARAIRQQDRPAVFAILYNDDNNDQPLIKYKKKYYPLVHTFEHTQHHLHESVPPYDLSTDYTQMMNSQVCKRLEGEAFRLLGARIDRSYYRKDPYKYYSYHYRW